MNGANPHSIYPESIDLTCFATDEEIVGAEVDGETLNISSLIDAPQTSSTSIPTSGTAIITPNGSNSKTPDYSPAISGIDLYNQPEKSFQVLVDGFLYAGCLNALIGPPKTGKSTLLFSMLLALVEGKDWMGKPTSLPGPILYITEQSTISFKRQLDRLPLEMGKRILTSTLSDGSPAIRLMHPEHHLSKRGASVSLFEGAWERNLKLWEQAIEKNDPAIVMIDTFGHYAGYKAGEENDNSVIGSRIGELHRLRLIKPTVGVLLSGHSNKAGSRGNKKYLGIVDIRGGNAYAGGLDHIVLVNRPQGQGRVSQKCYMTVESRLTEPEMYTLTLQGDGTYAREGSEEAASSDADTAQRLIAEAVIRKPELAELSIRDLADAVGVSKYQAEKYLKSIEVPAFEDGKG